jgi:hypothetical protein
MQGWAEREKNPGVNLHRRRARTECGNPERESQKHRDPEVQKCGIGGRRTRRLDVDTTAEELEARQIWFMIRT